MIGPLELYDASKPEWQMPDFIEADAVVKTGLIDGLAEIHDVASPAAFAGDVSNIHDVAVPNNANRVRSVRRRFCRWRPHRELQCFRGLWDVDFDVTFQLPPRWGRPVAE
jgi:hypothetical protein